MKRAVLLAHMVFVLGGNLALAQPDTKLPPYYLAVAQFQAGKVSILDPRDFSIVEEFILDIRPSRLLPLPKRNRVFVFPAFQDENNFLLDFDLRERQLFASIDTFSPFDGQSDLDETKVYVANYTAGSITVVDPNDDSVINIIQTTPTVAFFAFDPETIELYAGDNSHGRLTVYDTISDSEVRQFQVGAIQRMAVARGKVYWSTGGTSVRVNGANVFELITDIDLRVCCVTSILRSVDGERIYAVAGSDATPDTSVLVVIDTNSDEVIAAHFFTGGPWDAVINQGETTAYLALLYEDAVVALNLVTGDAQKLSVESPIALAIVPAATVKAFVAHLE